MKKYCFICKIYSQNTLSTKDVYKIVNAIIEILFEQVDIFSRYIKDVFKQIQIAPVDVFEISRFFKDFKMYLVSLLLKPLYLKL